MNPVQSLLSGVSQQGRCSVFFCLLSPFLAVFSVFLETEVFRDASARPINVQPSVQSLIPVLFLRVNGKNTDNLT